MRIVRYLKDGKESYGVLEDGVIYRVSSPLSQKRTGESFLSGEAKLFAPSAPTKIVCVGLNYSDHAAEMGLPLPPEPVIFIKPSTCALRPGGVIVYPDMSRQVDYEAELAVVIGRKAKDIKESEAGHYILGYTCLNDVTARDLQRKDGQWTRAKSFDTFAPFGPWIETELDTASIKVEAYLNGKRKQRSTTDRMIFKVPELLSFISRVMTLNPGDVVSTGTPPGIGPMKKGDDIEVRIEGIGSLVNTVG
ncbi:MAG TPA: fumarylacetoacetate hydrolase family protein [Nitrospirota bacterium]|jgi:2-keto-4-pentenoate hydratase/2-oxohepta-3-ene-1,7-dioic acid hydratase in catechol pathway